MEEGTSILGIIGRALLLPFRGIVYVLNPCNFCNTAPRIKRDAAIALRQVVDPRPVVYLHVEMSRISVDLGVSLVTVENGIAVFAVPEHHFGKIGKLTNREVNELHREYPNLEISADRKEIMIEIDTESIQNKYNGKSQKFQTRAEIAQQIYNCLNSVVKKTKAEGILVMDKTIITSIAKLLHVSHNYVPFEQKEISYKSPGANVLICIYNKGILEISTTGNTEFKAKPKSSNLLSNVQVMSMQPVRDRS
jgi:hypothetical protein